MSLRVVSLDQAAAELARQIGARSAVLELSDYAELWRLSVLLCPGQSRGQTAKSILSQFSPLELEPPLLQEALEVLLWHGDIQEGSGRKLHPAPLRGVTLADGVLIVGTGARRHLAKCPGKLLERDGIRFREGAADPELTSWLQVLGGRLVTPEVWAGISRSPLANDAYLSTLLNRPEAPPESENLQFFNLQTRRWELTQSDADGLWREQGDTFRTQYFLRYQQEWKRLRQDEANRCLFALARQEKISLANVERRAEAVSCNFLTYLPRAEYRYLCVQAKAYQKLSFVFDTQRWREVAKTLAERLGIENVEDQL